jgi:hypothetical protein
VQPEAWDRTYPRALGAVTGFLRKSPTLLFALPESLADRSGPWPSPRTWEMALRAWTTALVLYPGDGGVQADVLAGCIGSGTASAFVEWYTKQDLPDPEDILRDPEDERIWKLDSRADRVIAVLSSVVAAALREHPDRQKRLDACFIACGRARRHGMPDTAVACMEPLAQELANGSIVFSSTAVRELNALIPLLRAAGVIR